MLEGIRVIHSPSSEELNKWNGTVLNVSPQVLMTYESTRSDGETDCTVTRVKDEWVKPATSIYCYCTVHKVNYSLVHNWHLVETLLKDIGSINSAPYLQMKGFNYIACQLHGNANCNTLKANSIFVLAHE